MSLEKLRSLAERGDPSAQYNLGVWFADISDDPEATKHAMLWWEKAAAQGHNQAQYNLGHCHYEGELVNPDGVQAAKWFRLAAEGGMPQAQFALALLYHQGCLVEQDMEQALHWYLEASRQGFPQAIFNLADIHSQEGVHYDSVNAFKLFYIALVFGDENAKTRLEELVPKMTLEQIDQGQQAAQAVLATAQRVS